MNKRYILLALLILFQLSAIGQPLLSKGSAIEQVLQANFDIKVANQNTVIAENNTSLFNSGYLPTLTGNAGINYNIDNITAEFQDGEERVLRGAESDSRNASIGLGWTLFDGFNRKYRMQQNQANYSVSQLNARATLELVLLDLFSAYYEVARTQKAKESLQETLRISKARLLRTQYGFDYGQNTKLDVSNAQVDVNTDSINVLNANQALSNAVRNLNFLLARDANESFTVDTTISFDYLEDREMLKSMVLANNVQVLLARAGVTVSAYDTKISRSRYLPTLSLNGNYNYRLGNNNSASFLAANTLSGVSYGASLTWNFFDGGATRTAIQNARVNVTVQETLLRQATQQVILDFENAWSDYKNRLFVVQAEENNLIANRQNFQRTTEQYRLGRVTSLDFRRAQSNLLSAEINLVQAKYDAKLAELRIFQLAGNIQEADF